MNLPGIKSALVFGLASLALSLAPPPDRNPAEWAEQERIVSPIESKMPGPWRNDRFPVAVEIMEACSMSDPSTVISIRGSAQSIKTQISLNVVGSFIQDHPRGIMFVLPSNEHLTNYERTKLDPMLRATPSLRKLVYTRKNSSRKESTVKYKDFKDGFIILGTAGSSKLFQTWTVGLVVAEEIPEYPDDTGGRGFAVDQARERGSQYEGDGLKVLIPATPGIAGKCKQTKYFEAGTQGWIFWKCPHCGDHFRQRFYHLSRDNDRAVMHAPCCGAEIGHEKKREMNKHYPEDLSKGATFLHVFESLNPDNAFPWAKDDQGREISDVVRAEDFWTAKNRDLEGRDKSFHIWRGQSPFSSWARVLDMWDDAQEDPLKMKVFYQQALAEPYDEAVDVPPAAKLHAIAGGAPDRKKQPVMRGRVPSFAGFLTGSVDLQADRFEWQVMAHGPMMRSAIIDHGVIHELPMNSKGWGDLRAILNREYHSDHLRPQRLRRIGIDTGGLDTQMAYQFVRANPDILALKGRPNQKDPYDPPFEKSRKGARIKGPLGKIIERMDLMLINTHLLKKMIYLGLQNSLVSAETGELAPGFNLFAHDQTDLGFFEQLTSEVLVKDDLKSVEKWEKKQANEQLDMAVYNYALGLMFGMGKMTGEDWQSLFRAEAIDATAATLTPMERLMLPEADPANPLKVDRHIAHKPKQSILERIAEMNNKNRNI